MSEATDLQHIYRARFAGKSEYRSQIWSILSRFFSRWIPKDSVVLDLGCGWCEFINAASCSRKFGMDLNPDSARHAAAGVQLLQQDCSADWQLPPESLDVVFTSNFLEHLPDKSALERTLVQAARSLKPGGCFIAMGPNIKCVPGRYWDFFDHYIPLTELSLSEALQKSGFLIDFCRARFLPYTMSHGPRFPAWTLRLYLAFPIFWRFFGHQFLIVALKSARPELPY